MGTLIKVIFVITAIIIAFFASAYGGYYIVKIADTKEQVNQVETNKSEEIVEEVLAFSDEAQKADIQTADDIELTSSEEVQVSEEETEDIVEITNTPTVTQTPTPTITQTPSITSTPTPTPTLAPIAVPAHLEGLFTKYASQYGADLNLLKKVAKCESNFNNNAVGGGGAYVGMFQFSESSWITQRKLMGKDVNPGLRYGAEESIDTAAYAMSKGKVFMWKGCL